MNDELAVVPVVEEVSLGVIHVRAEDVVKRASAVATELAKVINDRKLFAGIQGKKYVTVEGWNTLGAMLGVLPVEREVKRIENGYEAAVDLIRTSDGMKVGGSSAICTRDEQKWATRDEYAVRSMAITRATGKAFRLGFSWIMKLAGYESTPAEEIIDAEPAEDVPVVTRKAPDAPAPKARPYAPDVLKVKVTEAAFKYRQDFVSGKKKPNVNRRQVLAAALGKIFPDDTQRYELCGWLADKSSTKEMSPEYVEALLIWMGVEDFNSLPTADSIAEAKSAHAAALGAKGQAVLPGVA